MRIIIRLLTLIIFIAAVINSSSARLIEMPAEPADSLWNDSLYI